MELSKCRLAGNIRTSDIRWIVLLPFPPSPMPAPTTRARSIWNNVLSVIVWLLLLRVLVFAGNFVGGTTGFFVAFCVFFAVLTLFVIWDWRAKRKGKPPV